MLKAVAEYEKNLVAKGVPSHLVNQYPDHIRDALRKRTQLSRTAWMRRPAPAGADLEAARAAAVRMSLAVPACKSPEHFLRHFITAARNRRLPTRA